MTIRASAPGRCGILGNPSDIYGGSVLACAVPARNTCILTSGSVQLEDRKLWDAATRRFPVHGYSVEWSSQVPRSSGLAGSTALLAATLSCILAARAEAPDLRNAEARTAFGELVRDVERNEAGVICGFQDAQMVVHGGLNLMDFAGKHPVNPGPPPRVRSIEASASLPFLLITTGVQRLSGSVHGPMVERWLSGDKEVIRVMLRLKELADFGVDALVDGNLEALGEMMSENQALVAALGGSGEAIDRLVQDCDREGALGTKLAGAGMGGTVIALTRNAAELEARLRSRGYSQFMKPSIEPGLILDSGNFAA